MDRLGVGAAFAISGLIIFVSSGSVGDKGIINEAINAFLVDSHPFALVARIGFGLMMLGTLMLGSWILFPGKPARYAEVGCDSDLVVVVDCQIPADDLIVHDL
ncbi:MULTISPECIES: hypothetical protein [Enterobacteriaceae]|uniref:hypothetical protein n=1 Tax=Enterobacteriaceae TaxID=543 RepID=UPI000DE5DBD2|nr:MULTISPECIES: hypothetical protein [Enterobacteriaceae]MCJ9665942.1 hypothetical protein [Escherichia coli]SSF98689.1 Uncharacterised protein [Klebsiella pneumoniae]